MRFFESPSKTLSLLVLLIFLMTSFYSLLSGPNEKIFGIKEKLPIDNVSREGRVILVYHSLAVPFTSLITIFLLATLSVPEGQRRSIVHSLVSGSFVTSLSALIFGYLNGGMIFHGLYVFGLSVVFYGGLNFLIALVRLKVDTKNKPYIYRPEKVALIILTIAILISAVYGAVVGSFFGTKFKAVLAEDIIRKEHSILDRFLISHLHIMLALLAASIMLLVPRYFRHEKLPVSLFYYLMIAGITVVSLSTWSVVIFEEIAHKIINVGAFLLILGSLVFVYSSISSMIKKRVIRIYELLVDFLLIFVNLVVTIPGIYVAVHLEKFRRPEMISIERTFAVGHWHLLGVICALLLLLIYFDFQFEKRKTARTLTAISIVLLSISMVFAVFYMFSRKSIYLNAIEITLAPGFLIITLLTMISLIYGFNRKGPEYGKVFNFIK